MIVLDASIVVELLTNGPLAEGLREELADRADAFIAPHLLDVEVLSALRRMTRDRIDPHRTRELIADLSVLAVDRYSHVPLLPRIWELRENFTAYDAAYIALAEMMSALLYTADEKLTKGHRAEVVLFKAGN